MSKKKWLLVILIIIILIACYKLFYKSYNKQQVAASADMVLAVDVKRNINSILAYYITTPSEWSGKSIFKSKKKKGQVDWEDAIKIPDYVFIFHSKNQPADAFYCILTIKDDDDFKEALKVYDFKERAGNNNTHEYYSSKLGIELIQQDERLLLGNLAIKDKSFIHSVADEVFNKKEYIASATLNKIVNAPNHFTFYVEQNTFLNQAVLFNGNFKKGELNITASLQPLHELTFVEDTFKISHSSILNLAFTQPSQDTYAMIPDTIKRSLSKAIGFNIDSLLIPGNKQYNLDIYDIQNRTDSAISYTYDDNFNAIENVVVNKVQEPSFNFTALGNNLSGLVDYWNKNKNIEKTSSGNLFISIPFVKTFVHNNTKDSLLLTSYNYIPKQGHQEIKGIAYLNINPVKIPENLLRYLPTQLDDFVSKVEFINGTAQKDNTVIAINLTVSTKLKTKPFLLCFE